MLDAHGAAQIAPGCCLDEQARRGGEQGRLGAGRRHGLHSMLVGMAKQWGLMESGTDLAAPRIRLWGR
ncbi:hypothetical protein NY78_3484 [Desulfovibrio sp. TomC]|nr:hypothetical protein NY78_3484 [Desulfovibrio sp. TomC]